MLVECSDERFSWSWCTEASCSARFPPPCLACSGCLPLPLSLPVFVAGSAPTGLAAAQEEGAMQMNTS